MKLFNAVLAASFAAVILSEARAQESAASWLRTQTAANALNPNISLIGDFVGTAGPRRDAGSNRMALRETELGIQAAVDPYARADFFVGFHEGESAELEEGYVTLLALPLGFQGRGGKFLANFGKLNMVHSHERPQVDAPLVLESFLGEEGMNDTGVEISHVMAPFGMFAEFSYGVLNGLGGEHHHEGDSDTVLVAAVDESGSPLLDVDGNPVYVETTVHDEEPEIPRTIRNFAHVARLRFYQDVTDASNIEIGFSGALHQPEMEEQRKLAGADLTFRWKPLEGNDRSFIWRTEGLYSSRRLLEETDITGAVTAPARKLDRRGFYSYAEIQPARRWRFGVRGDYVEDPEAKDEVFSLSDGSSRQVSRSITRAVSPYIGFTLSEFNRFRVQYSHRHLPGGENESRGFFQWVVVLGPHGAHPF